MNYAETRLRSMHDVLRRVLPLPSFDRRNVAKSFRERASIAVPKNRVLLAVVGSNDRTKRAARENPRNVASVARARAAARQRRDDRAKLEYSSRKRKAVLIRNRDGGSSTLGEFLEF